MTLRLAIRELIVAVEQVTHGLAGLVIYISRIYSFLGFIYVGVVGLVWYVEV